MEFTETVKEKSDTALLKMVYEYDQWSPEMLRTIETELKNRNILPADLAEHHQKRLEEEKQALMKGEEANMLVFIIGWLTVFGLLGIMIGYNYAFGKTKSKYTDDTYFKYEEKVRKNGKNLFYTSIVLTSLTILYRFTVI